MDPNKVQKLIFIHHNMMELEHSLTGKFFIQCGFQLNTAHKPCNFQQSVSVVILASQIEVTIFTTPMIYLL